MQFLQTDEVLGALSQRFAAWVVLVVIDAHRGRSQDAQLRFNVRPNVEKRNLKWFDVIGIGWSQQTWVPREFCLE